MASGQGRGCDPMASPATPSQLPWLAGTVIHRLLPSSFYKPALVCSKETWGWLRGTKWAALLSGPVALSFCYCERCHCFTQVQPFRQEDPRKNRQLAAFTMCNGGCLSCPDRHLEGPHKERRINWKHCLPRDHSERVCSKKGRLCYQSEKKVKKKTK